MSRQSLTAAEKKEHVAWLTEHLQRCPTVFCIHRHTSRSGMQREISFYVFGQHNGQPSPVLLDYRIGQLLGLREGSHGGLIVHGCGMDMGFHVVSHLYRELYGSDYPEGRDHRWI